MSGNSVKEPIGVDFYFDGREMTAEDQKRVSDYLQSRKKLLSSKAPGTPAVKKQPKKINKWYLLFQYCSNEDRKFR
jgi:hypothetical protein